MNLRSRWCVRSTLIDGGHLQSFFFLLFFSHAVHAMTAPTVVQACILFAYNSKDLGGHLQSQRCNSKAGSICKYDIQKFPAARANPNIGSEHWVFDGLLGLLLPGALKQVVGRSLNNKIFPNKKNLQKLFVDAFHTFQGQRV